MGPSAAVTVAAVRRPAPPPAPNASAGLLAHSYFTDGAPAVGAGPSGADPTSMPRAGHVRPWPQRGR